jgi:flagellar motor switch protein FliM
MPERLLTSPEIDALLAMFRGGDAHLSAESYDLDTPSVAPRGALESVLVRHEAAARELRDELGGLFNADVGVELESFEQMRFGALKDVVPEGACGFLAELAPLRDPAYVAVDPGLAFAAVDRLLGGKGEATVAAREFTTTELAVVEDLVRPIVAAHATAWSPYVPMKAGAARAIAGLRFVRELKSDDVVFVARYRVRKFCEGATITFATPSSGLEPHLQRDPRPIAAPKDGAFEKDLAAHVAEVRVDMNIRVGGATLTLRELTSLEIGDVVVLDRSIDEGCDLCVGDLAKFKGWLGAGRGRLTFRVQSPVAPPPQRKQEAPPKPAPRERAK